MWQPISEAEEPQKRRIISVDHPRYQSLVSALNLVLPVTLLGVIFEYEYDFISFSSEVNGEAARLSDNDRTAHCRLGPCLLVGNVSLPSGGYMDWTFEVTKNTNFSCGVITDKIKRNTSALYMNSTGCIGVSNNVLGSALPAAQMTKKRMRVSVDDNKAFVFAGGVLILEQDIPAESFPVRLAVSCFRSAIVQLID